eukprot:TRINITY_DN80867_c0_g1_i1.p1 TRINITY_DN80867_c0_g1~~TRINITY_DN80867_c0_g1_i1.p1  ORF type:complete len:220 (-),score=21.97 TRINITY_DN80867_c0_g1_i1:269-928(-)
MFLLVLMKNVVSLSVLIILLMSFGMGCNSNKNLIAQSGLTQKAFGAPKDIEKINGDQLLEAMLAERFLFNKMLIKNGFNAQNQYPKVISILNREAATVSFNGLDYSIMNNKIVGIKGIKLSLSALTTLTEKMVKLDQNQQYYCEQANLAYQVKNRDLQTIKTFDRQYFAALRNIRLITHDIAEIAKKPNPSVSIEISIAKIKLPDGKIEFKRSYVAEVE